MPYSLLISCASLQRGCVVDSSVLTSLASLLTYTLRALGDDDMADAETLRIVRDRCAEMIGAIDAYVKKRRDDVSRGQAEDWKVAGD